MPIDRIDPGLPPASTPTQSSNPNRLSKSLVHYDLEKHPRSTNFPSESKTTSAKDEARRRLRGRVSSSKETTPADRFKEAFSRDNVRVHFVGVWYVLSKFRIACHSDLLVRIGTRFLPSELFEGNLYPSLSLAIIFAILGMLLPSTSVESSFSQNMLHTRQLIG